MSKTYAIADLHGRFDLLEMAVAKIANHAELPATGHTWRLCRSWPRQPEGYRAAYGWLKPGRLAADLPQRQPRGHHVADLPPQSTRLRLVANQWWRRDSDLLRATRRRPS